MNILVITKKEEEEEEIWETLVDAIEICQIYGRY